MIGAPTSLLNEARAAHRGADPLEHGAQEVLGRGLAVRAGDADDAEPAEGAHAAHDLAREGAERVDRVGDDDLRHRQVERALDDEAMLNEVDGKNMAH